MEEVKTDVVSSINALGIRASGLSSSTAEVRKTKEGGAALFLEGYIVFVIDGIGRRPGGVNYSALEDWVQSKGLSLGGKTALQVAFAIGTVIRAEGTKIFKKEKKGIPLQKIIKENLKSGGIRRIGNKGVVPDFVEELNKLVLTVNRNLN